MKEIKYTLTSRGAFVTEINTENSEEVTFKLNGEDNAILKIGEKTYKISHGACRIRPGEINDGIYTPELITDFGATRLDTFAIFFGVMKLYVGELELLKTSRELSELLRRIDELEEKNRKLHDAVFGTKLF